MGHFYFARHGQTVWNVENKICGATDIELTKLGHQQAIELGKKIVAEGIETEKEALLMKEWGVDMIQGYYYSKPEPYDRLIKILERTEQDHENCHCRR